MKIISEIARYPTSLEMRKIKRILDKHFDTKTTTTKRGHTISIMTVKK